MTWWGWLIMLTYLVVAVALVYPTFAWIDHLAEDRDSLAFELGFGLELTVAITAAFVWPLPVVAVGIFALSYRMWNGEWPSSPSKFERVRS